MTATRDFNYTAVTPEQGMALEDSSPDLLLWGPGGSGKTECGTVKAIAVAAQHPNNRIFLIRRKKVDLRLTLWKRFIERVPMELVASKDENRMYYKLTNGTEFLGLGLDTVQDVNKLASAECGMAVIEEAIEINEEHFDEKIKRAVRLPSAPFHQTLLLCNPGTPAHWIHKRWIMEKRQGYRNLYMPTIPQEANVLPQTFYDWLYSLTGIFAKRYREGKWVAIEGLVYTFDPEHHIIDPFPIHPNEGKVVCANDFGYDHPFVGHWWWVSPEDIWYLYREIYKTHKRVALHGEDMVGYFRKDARRPSVICDHDAENMADLRAAGIDTRHANKERLAGQQSVEKLFEEDRIFFFRDCLVERDMRRVIRKLPTCTVEEFPLYGWSNKGKEDMIKEFDDGMDTMRYAVHTGAPVEIDKEDIYANTESVTDQIANEWD